MLKSLALSAALGVFSTLFVANAGALPLAQDKFATAAETDVTLVADGCGRGMRYSRSRGRCVRQGDSDPVRGIIKEIVRPGRDCGRGFHYSERRGRCVRN
jgi:hypothetical protein